MPGLRIRMSRSLASSHQQSRKACNLATQEVLRCPLVDASAPRFQILLLTRGDSPANILSERRSPFGALLERVTMSLNDTPANNSAWATTAPNWPSKVPNHPSGPGRTTNPPRPGKN